MQPPRHAALAYDAIIIGAGHNGLVAAAYLAKAGQRVLVLERSDVVGGAAVSEHPWDGWTVSSASYVCSLLHPEIIRELELVRHGYEATLKNPASFNVLEDGRSLLISRDRAANAAEIARFSARDVSGFERLDHALGHIASELFDHLNADQPRFAALSHAAQAMFLGSAAEFAERYVETPVLRAAIATDGIIGTFAGPRDPGTGYVLAHHYAGRAFGIQGAWGYVRGGMGTISNAIANAAREHGAEIRIASPVVAIRGRGEKATGVVLADGSEIEAAAVLSNADPKTTFLRLAPAGSLPPEFVERVQRWRDEGIVVKLNLALGELPIFSARPLREAGPQHNATIHIAPDVDYIQRAFEDAVRGLPARQPFLELYLQSPNDSSIAPKGKHLLSIFAQYFPYQRADGEWTAEKKRQAADAIVATLAKYAPNVPQAIEAQQLFTPPDLEQRFNLPRGHIFHGELLPGQIFEDRFASRTPLAGLYLCGSGAHPGGCVSGIPGWRAARALLHDRVAGRV